MSGLSARIPAKARTFAAACLLLLATDCTTKQLAVGLLPGPHRPVRVVGDLVRFTLAYNTGAALGISLGPRGRLALSAASVLAMGVIAWQLAALSGRDRRSALALGLVAGGALGNLTDRLLSSQGVVDFIDIGLGAYRYWTFNVADVGIVVGAALLILSSFRPARPPEDRDAGGAVLVARH